MDLYQLLNTLGSDKEIYPNSKLFTEEQKQLLDGDYEKRTYDLLKDLSSLAMFIKDNAAEFCPYMEFGDNRTFSIKDLREDDYEILKGLDLMKIPDVLRARIADILWTQEGDYHDAIVAAQSYTELFVKWFSEENGMKSLDIARRAVCISKQINNQSLYNNICQAVYNALIELSDEDYFLSLRLLEILISYNYGDQKLFIPILDTIIENSQNDVTKTEQAYQLEEGCYRNLKDSDGVKQCKVLLADYYMNFGETTFRQSTQGAFKAQNFFKKAIDLYRENGEPLKAENVHKRLIEIQKDIPNQMASIEFELNVDDVYKYIDDNFKGLTFEESIIRLAQLVTFYKKDDLKKDILDELQERRLTQLVTQSVYNKYGQIVVTINPLDPDNPEGDKDLLDKHINQRLKEECSIEGDLFIRLYLKKIRQTFDINQVSLDFLVENNAIIPNGREKIFSSALFMILNEDYYEAMHILAPQMETLFRNVAKQVGGLTEYFDNDDSQKEKALGSIFDLPDLKDSYDNDILYLFKALLDEPSGGNIRNDIAHGLVDEEDASSGIYLYFAGAVIKLLVMSSQQCLTIYEKSEKL